MQRTQLIIVRHGETEWNIKSIRQGNLDSRLTEKGMAQAKALAQRVARNIAYLNEIGSKHLGETIVVVTHGGVISGLFRHTFSIPFNAPRRFEFTNAGLNIFAYDEGNWFLLTWGDVSHLAPDGRTEGEDP